MTSKYNVIVSNLTKTFQLDSKNKSSLFNKILNIISKKSKGDFIALDNINFNLEPGKNLGVIGNNGSGKSTLLKIIAGIYKLDSGYIKTEGSVIYLSGFNSGLKKRLTMRENIYLIGSLMGLSRNEINSKFEEIVEFSGLRDYVDHKVDHFSSGMIARLNFSVGIYCISHDVPDILLVDEAITVGGDILFRAKAFEKLRELIRGGSSVILASHGLEGIKKHCDSVIWIDKGKVIMIGKPDVVVESYIKDNSKKRLS